MKHKQPDWRWEEGAVDERAEHMELRHGNAEETAYENWTPMARLAKPMNHVFKVEWLVQQESPQYESMLADVRRSLDFYLIENDDPDPWDYAFFHCSTGANQYSSVRWSYFPTSSQGK